MALDNLSFQVGPGETVGIIGPNGAGKTTLFDLMTGFQSPTSGTVSLNGQDITGRPPSLIVQRGMSRTFQLVRPFKDLTVLENVLVGLTVGRGKLMRAKGQRELREQAMELLELVGLTRAPLSLAQNLSQGELKKMELARALSTFPDVLLLDEVFSGLSAQETNELADSLVRLKEKRSLTLLMVEHRVSKVVQLAGRMIVLDHGKLLSQGTPREILNDARVLEAYLGRG